MICLVLFHPVVLAVIWFLVFNLTKNHLSVKFANWFQHVMLSLPYSFQVDLWKGVVTRVLLISGLEFAKDHFPVLDMAANNVPFQVHCKYLGKAPQIYLSLPNFTGKNCVHLPLCSVSFALFWVKGGVLGVHMYICG